MGAQKDRCAKGRRKKDGGNGGGNGLSEGGGKGEGRRGGEKFLDQINAFRGAGDRDHALSSSLPAAFRGDFSRCRDAEKGRARTPPCSRNALANTASVDQGRLSSRERKFPFAIFLIFLLKFFEFLVVYFVVQLLGKQEESLCCFLYKKRFSISYTIRGRRYFLGFL